MSLARSNDAVAVENEKLANLAAKAAMANTANAEAVFVAIAVFAAAEKGSAAATFAAK